MQCPISLSIDKYAHRLGLEQERDEQIEKLALQIVSDFEKSGGEFWDEIWDYLDCEKYRIAVSQRDVPTMRQIELSSALIIAEKIVE